MCFFSVESASSKKPSCCTDESWANLFAWEGQLPADVFWFFLTLQANGHKGPIAVAFPTWQPKLLGVDWAGQLRSALRRDKGGRAKKRVRW